MSCIQTRAILQQDIIIYGQLDNVKNVLQKAIKHKYGRRMVSIVPIMNTVIPQPAVAECFVTFGCEKIKKRLLCLDTAAFMRYNYMRETCPPVYCFFLEPLGGGRYLMYRIGIDLGGTNIAVGLVDESMNIVVKQSMPTQAQRAPELIVDDMATLCRRVAAEKGIAISEVAAVGIASPGIVDNATGRVEYANNLPFRKLPIADMLKSRIGELPVHIANDANAAAWGEAVAGAAKGSSNSVMITLGTGVGGGVIIDNKILTGFNNAGAELGHIVISAGGRQCSCGRLGCWEAYSSATALINMTREKLEECRIKGRHTLIEDIANERGKISGRTACDAMRAGDEAAAEVFREYVYYLTCGLVNIINIFQPEVISLGGGISNEGDFLLKPLIPMVRKEQYGGGIVPETQIRIAKLGNDAGIVGAAMLK